MKRSRIVRILPALLLMTSFAWAQAPSDTRHGKVVYERYCLACHGEFGDGKGEMAEWISPKPRDFRQGTFKWRSTPSGSLPLMSDLEKTVENGLYGTNMLSWYPIGRRSRLDAIAYIQTFSPRWREEKPQPPIVIPSEPPNNAESVTRGRAVYEKMDCAKCHGDSGRGDGPSAKELKDDWGDPVLPYDLSGGHMKCGDTGADIYRVFMTGLNGAPMPSFADSISTEEAWDLVHYIQSLNRETRRAATSGR